MLTSPFARTSLGSWMTLFLNAHCTLHRDSFSGNGDLYPQLSSSGGFICTHGELPAPAASVTGHDKVSRSHIQMSYFSRIKMSDPGCDLLVSRKPRACRFR